jgi:hypothetical protein
MSLRSDDYRARAAECQERAKVARDPEVRRQFEELAHQWAEMAVQDERMNR